MELFQRWNDDAKKHGGAFACGKSVTEMAADFADWRKKKMAEQAVTAPTGDQLARRLSELFGIPVEVGTFADLTGGPVPARKMTKKEKKQAKRDAKKRKGS